MRVNDDVLQVVPQLDDDSSDSDDSSMTAADGAVPVLSASAPKQHSPLTQRHLPSSRQRHLPARQVSVASARPVVSEFERRLAEARRLADSDGVVQRPPTRESRPAPPQIRVVHVADDAEAFRVTQSRTT